MTEWLEGNKICNATLCARFEELMGQGMSQRQAARQIEKDQEEKWGTVLFSRDLVRARYRSIKQGKWRGIYKHSRDEKGRYLPKGVKGVDERVAMEGSGTTLSSRPIFTMAMDFATMAIGHLSRIPKDDPNLLKAMYRVRKWVNEFIKEGRKKNAKKGQR